MTTLRLPAPAKLNLFLHITGQRADGYHTLQTLFQILDYGDTLELTARTDSIVNVTPALPGLAPDENLVWRAADALRRHTGFDLGVDIRLTKRLPAGGGLGGGSSDAATALHGLNRLWKLGLTTAELAALGLALGADVPVFVHGHTAWAEGVGERLEPVALGERFYLVIAPDTAVSTAAVFADKHLTRNTQPITLAAFLKGGGRNDCEPVVRARYPAVDRAMVWLSQYAEPRLTGTGACIFASFDNRHSADAVLAAMRKEAPANWQGFVAGGTDRSPLMTALES